MPPEVGALIQRDVEFHIFSKALDADEEIILKELGLSEPDGKKRVRTTASSNIKDLSGDEMTTKALESMRSSAEENMTIFLNHRYAVPGDVFGSVEKATLVDKGDYVDLDLIIRVDETNPAAVQTHASIVGGTKLGTSIGALIPKGGATKTEDGLSIDDVRLLEASIVGIPANPRSFVQYATKALRQAQLDDAPEDEVESSGPPKPMLRAGEAATQTGLPTTVGEDGPESIEKATTWVKTKPDGSADVVVESDPPAAAEAAGAAAGGGKGSAKSGEPDTTKEATPPDEGDEGEPDAGDEPAEDAGEQPAETTEATQDAPSTESTPETDGAAIQAAVDEQLKVASAQGLDTLAELLKGIAEKLGDVTKQLVDETALRKAAELRASDAEADVALAKEIIEKISVIPLGRNTAFKAGVSEFRKRLSHVYSDEVMDLVER